MGEKYTEAQKRANEKYQTEKTDLLRIRVPKGRKDVYKEYAKQRGQSLTAFVFEAIEDKIKK